MVWAQLDVRIHPCLRQHPHLLLTICGSGGYTGERTGRGAEVLLRLVFLLLREGWVQF